MKSLRQLLDSIDGVSEQRTAMDSDLAKYRAGLISFKDLKKSEEFRRMPIEDRWKQGLMSMNDLTPMDKYRLGMINQDQLARSQAIEPVYPELAAAGAGGAIRAGLGLLGRKGAETTARQAATKVEPTFTAPATQAPKPRIERRPGESVSDAIKRAQAEKGGAVSTPPAAQGPAVWRNPRTGEVGSTPPGGGAGAGASSGTRVSTAPSTPSAPARPTAPSSTTGDRLRQGRQEKVSSGRTAQQDSKDRKKALAASLAGHAGLAYLLSPDDKAKPAGGGGTDGTAGSGPLPATIIDAPRDGAPASADGPGRDSNIRLPQVNIDTSNVPAHPENGGRPSIRIIPVEPAAPTAQPAAPTAQPAAPTAQPAAQPAAQPPKVEPPKAPAAQPVAPANAPSSGTGGGQGSGSGTGTGTGTGSGQGDDRFDPVEYLKKQKVPGYKFNESRSTKKLMREFSRHLNRVYK
jgi:hypothetical protein